MFKLKCTRINMFGHRSPPPLESVYTHENVDICGRPLEEKVFVDQILTPKC